MRLTQQQALDRLMKPKNAMHITAAREHEQRLAMHTEPLLRTEFLPGNAYLNFTGWVKMILPPDKYVRFCQLLSFPLDTVDSTKAIFDEISKVFDAQDSFKKFDFVNSELADDFLQYTEKIKDADFWKTTGFNALKNKINSIYVVDLPKEQTTFNPEPYYFLLTSDLLIDVEFNSHDGRVEYVIYSQQNNRAIVLDDEFYRMYIKPENGGDWTLENQVPHSIYKEDGTVSAGLGYCPAEPFYKITIAGSNQVNKRAPITDTLGKFDWLLFWRTSVKYFEIYGAWPIIVTYESKCAFKDEKGNECEGGRINTHFWNGEEEIATVIDCPACKSRELIGPGSSWTVKAPRDKDEFNMMDSPAKIIEIPVDNLKYVVERIDALENEAYLNVVGYDGDAMAQQAVNKTQVAANFESKESVLDTIKNEFQRGQKFVLDTVARLRYGNYFVKSTIDWGNEYFLKSVDKLTLHLKDARENGMPMFYISSVRNKIVQTQCKSNPDEQKRNAILEQLEPYPDLSITQLQSLGIKEDDPLNYLIKLNFTTFVQRFEREAINIVEFGSLISFDKKIELINNKLLEYAREYRSKAAGAQLNSGGNENHQGGTTTR